ncbi:NtaA/DmoA family FMN-dependent monooxygenase [Herbiconiux moechotypicola]|uniref:NtaA/DmoA family FMN-dependent monooxygenase n=1 Tax=Herbiconiux moechotypicola TaxID=637393 RepID=A0ABN3DP62_9MICO|nr:NtaA/DmoA family FMN-dependent monooxygenase [Herbiconiux moechotypicola]MCS5730358.1 NtaA/DmoA family FMN-dependent monooxygenase [Herbiconiux moechotypicola]
MTGKQVHLTLNLQSTGRHDAAWKTLDPAGTGFASDWIDGIDYFTRIAQIAERGRFDAIFIADRLGGLDRTGSVRPWRGLDPTVLLAALARETSHIGLASTNPAIHGNPFLLARQIASLDHVSKGRGAWNIITSQEPTTLRALGKSAVLDAETRYRAADEFVSIVDAFWRSLPPEAIVADAEADLYIDETLTRPVDIAGEFFSGAGVLPLTGGYRGNRPVLFQAGTSRASKEFGARWADALFTSQRLPELGRAFADEVKGLAEANGRSRDELLVLPGLYVVLGDTEQAAQRRKAELDELLALEPLIGDLSDYLEFDVSGFDLDQELPYGELAGRASSSHQTVRRHQIVADAKTRGLTIRQLLFNNLSGGQRVIVGTPEQVADDIETWVDLGAADGFTINIDVQTAGFEAFVDGVVTELQNRGRFRREYEHDTLRGHLGLAASAPTGQLVGA